MLQSRTWKAFCWPPRQQTAISSLFSQPTAFFTTRSQNRFAKAGKYSCLHRKMTWLPQFPQVHPTDPCRKSKSSVLTKGNISSISGMSQAALVKLRMLEHGWQLRGLGARGHLPKQLTERQNLKRASDISDVHLNLESKTLQSEP